MRHGRRDSTHKAIKRALLDIGCSVFDTADVGGGFPDLVVGYHGVTILLEVKGPKGFLRELQTDFAEKWRGSRPMVVRTPQEAVVAVFTAAGLAPYASVRPL